MELYKQFKSFDKLIVLYCIFTAIYMSFGFSKLENLHIHILFRIVFITIILILIKYSEPEKKSLWFIRNFYPLLLLGFFYGETDYYNNLIFKDLDAHLIKFELLVFQNQLSIVFSNNVPYRWFSELMHFGYFSYYLFTFGVPLIFYLKQKDKFDKTMFIIIFSFCLYYILFTLFPTIGPQFYFDFNQTQVPNGFFFDKLMHIVVKYGETETGAFPSSHVGLTIIFLILLWENFRKYFWISLIPAVLLILSTVYIKAHYAIDIIAGLLSGYLFCLLSNWVFSFTNNSKTKPTL